MARSGPDPNQGLREAQKGLQSLFGSLIAGSPPMSGAQPTWSPPMDVYRTGNNIIVMGELPGVKPEAIKVDFTGSSLRIAGERWEKADKHKEGYYLMENEYGRFSREIPLPATAEGDRISATYKNGFLIVTIPLGKRREQAGLEIPIT